MPPHLGALSFDISLPWFAVSESDIRFMLDNAYPFIPAVPTKEVEEENKQKQREIERVRVLKWEQDKFDEANKITYAEYKSAYPTHFLYSDYYGRDEGYFLDREELVEYWEDEFGLPTDDEYTLEGQDYPQMPRYVWGTVPLKTYKLDSEEVINQSFDYLDEERDYIQFAGTQELDVALKQFYEANCSLVRYMVCYKLVVMLERGDS